MHDRECPHPKCTTIIWYGTFACRPHWFSLPPSIRTEITAAYRWFKRDPLKYAERLDDAQEAATDYWDASLTDDADKFDCPVCHGRRTIQPDPCTPPEPCPRCVDEDADA